MPSAPEERDFNNPWTPPAALPGLNATVRARATAAGGSGCGTGAQLEFSSEGRELTLGFDSNELELQRTQARLSLQCTAKIALTSSVPVSFAVSRLYAQGYTELDPGVHAQLRLGFRDPLGAWHGPVQRDVDGIGEFHMFRLDQSHRTEELAWSPCGTHGEVALQTYFALKNGSPMGYGTVDMCSTLVGGKPSSEAGLTLVWRACTPDEAAPPPSL